MKDLYSYKASDVISYLVEEQAQKLGVSKALARQLVVNALTYNVVIEAIEEQVSFLMAE